MHVVKDLGVTFDSSLTFQEHIVKTVSSCCSSLAQINRVKHVFDRSTLITIINTLVFSKLFYCPSVWSSAAATNLLKLQAVQNFAAKIICGSRKFSLRSKRFRAVSEQGKTEERDSWFWPREK